MMISTKGEYALRMMLDLAINNTGESITIKSIASRQGLPEKYLEQIVAVFSKAGYVKSVRGSKGGYRLSDSLRSYTVGMILRTIEGSLSPAACIDSVESRCIHMQDCVTYEVFEELNQAINHVVDNITLEDLLRRHLEKGGDNYII